MTDIERAEAVRVAAAALAVVLTEAEEVGLVVDIDVTKTEVTTFADGYPRHHFLLNARVSRPL